MAKLPGGAGAARGKTIWYVPIGSGIPVLDTVGTAMQQSLKGAGVTIHVCNGKFLPTTIASCFSQAAQQGASEVVAGAVDYNSVATAVNNLAAKHIPVLDFAEAPPAGGGLSPYIHFYNTVGVTEKYSRLAVDSAIADSQGKAHILYIGYTDSALGLSATAAAQDEVSTYCGGCSMNTVTYQTAAINKLQAAVSADLIRQPQTDYVVVQADEAIPSVIAALKTSTLNGKIKIAGVTGELASMQMVEQGQQFSDAGWSAPYFGWSVADGALRVLVDKPFTVEQQDLRVFDKSNVGGLTLTPAAYANGSWYGKPTYQSAFLQAWGIS